MSKAPKRPAGIPAKAWWDATDDEWVFGPLVEGKKHGDFTYWRADGTKCSECHLVMDVPHGAFKRFHENGELSQEGTFEKGQLHGIRHFNRAGERVLPANGDPYPLRPAGVDEGAEFVEPKDEWHRGDAASETQHKVGRWRCWTREGQLKEDGVYVDDVRHGPATVFVQGGNPFTDPRIAQERGEFREGRRSGVWLLCDASGATLGKCDYGDTRSLEGGPLAAYSNDCTVDWVALARKLETEGKVVEALVTWARAAGSKRDLAGFHALLASVARPVKEEVAVTLAVEVDRPTNWLGYELVEGAHAALVLSKLAVALDQAFQSRAALDFSNAAILLAPDRTELLFTRALVLMSLGLQAQAELDANELAAEAPDRAEFLLVYLRGLFPSYGFGPATEKPQTSFEDVPEKPERSLEELQLLAQKYATRIHLVREALLEKLTPRNPALPPELTRLLPKGPVALEQGEHAWEDDEGEPQTVDFDELPEVKDASLPSLLRLARADWNALSWLCWAAGLTEVALPKKLAPPEDFGKAAGMAQQRLWRSRDQRAFSGRNARQHGVASFEWEGTDMAEIAPPVAGIAEQQYAEMQALFYWLVDSKLKTPWQDNLRGS